MIILLYLICISFSLFGMEEGISKTPGSPQEEHQWTEQEMLQLIGMGESEQPVTKKPKPFSKTFFVEEGWQCKPYHLYECPRCTFYTVAETQNAIAVHMQRIHNASPSLEDLLKNKKEKPWMLPSQWDSSIRKLFVAWVNLVDDNRKTRLNTDVEAITQEVKDQFETIQKLLKSRYAYFDSLRPLAIKVKAKKRPIINLTQEE